MRRIAPMAALLAVAVLAGCGGSEPASSEARTRRTTTGGGSGAATGDSGVTGAPRASGSGSTTTTRTGGGTGGGAAAPTTTTVVTDPVCRGSNQRVDRDVPYATVSGVDPSLLSLDVYAPVRDAACPRTHVLVSVHRGGWSGGDKADIGRRAALALREGWVLVSVNHRVAPAAKYPTFDEDVARAIAWVTQNIGRYGGDPAHITIMGTESGAVVSAETVADARHLARAGLPLAAVRCAVLADGRYDIAALGRTGSPAVLAAYGNDPRVWSDASAIGHIAPGTGMARLLVIVRGTAAERASGIALANRARASGVPATVLTAAAFSGPALDDAIGAADETIITPSVTDFIRSC